MVRRLFGLLVPFLGSAIAVYLATRLFDQERFDHVVSLSVAAGDKEATAQTIAVVTVIFGLVNLLVKPVVRLFTFPIRILSFGLFSLIINGGLLLLVGQLAGRFDLPFHVEITPWVIAAAAFIGIVAGILNWLGDKISRPRKVVVKEKVVERVVERPAPQVPQYQPPAPPRPAPRPAPSYTPPPAPQYQPPAQPQYPPSSGQPQYPPAQPQYPPAGPQYPPPPGPYGPGQGQTPGYGGPTYGSGQ